MRVGYARVSTDNQRLDLQTQALHRAGCQRLFIDHGVSGATAERAGLDKMMKTLKSGDTLVVWRLDRLGRSLSNLIELMRRLEKRGIHLHSLTENIDTTSSGGRLLFHMMAALAEFERTLISERTKAGMEAARRKGKRLGRPPGLNGTHLLDALSAVANDGESIDVVATRFNISPRTLRRAIQAERARSA